MSSELINIPFAIPARDLKLGDVVDLDFMTGPFNTAIVRQATPEFVILFRPYVHNSDFSHTGGIICYHGSEDVTLLRDSTVRLMLRERRMIK